MKNSKWIIPILAMLLILIDIFVKTQITNGFNTRLFGEIAEYIYPVLTNIMKAITYMGDSISVTVFCVILVIYSKTRIKYGVLISSGVLTAAVLYIILKVLIKEPPYRLLSGHTMINTTLYLLLFICIYRYVENKKLKYILLVICAIIPFLIGMSRVYLGFHYIADVIAGWIVGIIISTIVYIIYKIIVKKLKG